MITFHKRMKGWLRVEAEKLSVCHFGLKGDNCYFGTGVTVLAPCRIGNNVTVAAGAVVTMPEIPDNAVVAGVPARIVKIKEQENNFVDE